MRSVIGNENKDKGNEVEGIDRVAEAGAGLNEASYQRGREVVVERADILNGPQSRGREQNIMKAPGNDMALHFALIKLSYSSTNRSRPCDTIIETRMIVHSNA
ncbi:saf domain protein [Lasius niger]|uniref:Saf domain protein n=1 Tax=Lasius niger TaxID=67767 RepID=A0A0J7KWL3_LASNI|nr:saf domain protein [Lasius niger]